MTHNFNLKEAAICLFFVLFFGCQPKKETAKKEPVALEILENSYKQDIQECIHHLSSLMLTKNKEELLENYLKARTSFKKMEAILSFVDKENYKALNQPNFLKVEEEDLTNIKYNEAFGFQTIEELISEEKPDYDAIVKVSQITKNRLKLIFTNTKLELKNHHVLWLIKDAILRLTLVGNTGFDSPVLENSLSESQIVYREIRDVLKLYASNFKDKDLLKKWNDEIETSIKILNTDFNTFDHYSFIKEHSHKQLEFLVKTQKDWEVVFPFDLAVNNDATSLFSEKTFNPDFFTRYNKKLAYSDEKAKLGKKLFHDTKLSSSNTMSCATCHQADKGFADGLKVFPKQKRNTPTVLYAGLQKAFFYDRRSGSLEGQIINVVENENEFHSDLKQFLKTVSSDSAYKTEFKTVFKQEISEGNIRNAIASYIRSLAKFNSKFDRNINKLENSLTVSEKNGFNLFMGKAKCATCHFPPTFNGTIPPNFKESEIESIGVPKLAKKGSEIDNDLGTYHIFKTEERKHFFKTSTIRNVSKTAPYMHNGVYKTLEEVVEFYNNGGGSGLGFDLAYQTLPSDSLHLSKNEITDLVNFMKTLEDQEVY